MVGAAVRKVKKFLYLVQFYQNWHALIIGRVESDTQACTFSYIIIIITIAVIFILYN